MTNHSTPSGAYPENEAYRYKLWRIWDRSKPMLLFVMLNPSTADASNDDPTMKACRAFAENWGFGGFFAGNLFAWRSTQPEGLLKADDPVGPENEHCLLEMAAECDQIVAAWGCGPVVRKLEAKLADVDFYKPLKDMTLQALVVNKDGTPRHPLYVKRDTIPVEWKR